MNDAEHRDGKRAYEDYWHHQMADPKFRRVYEEEAAKKELWLQLVEAPDSPRSPAEGEYDS